MSRFDTGKPMYPNYVTDRPAATYNGVIEVNTLYGAHWGYPGGSTAYLDALLKGIECQQQGEADSQRFNLDIVRIEFVYRTHFYRGLTLQGAILFDQRMQAALHFGHALLGYEGSGPEHSRAILQLLGVPAGIFGDINNIASQYDGHNREYEIVLQKHTNDLWEVISTL